MATLHLPKNRPVRKKDLSDDRVDRKLDESLKQTFPANDPLSITIPGGLVTVGDSAGNKSDRKTRKDG
jgi:hypothetical protein